MERSTTLLGEEVAKRTRIQIRDALAISAEMILSAETKTEHFADAFVNPSADMARQQTLVRELTGAYVLLCTAGSLAGINLSEEAERLISGGEGFIDGIASQAEKTAAKQAAVMAGKKPAGDVPSTEQSDAG